MFIYLLHIQNQSVQNYLLITPNMPGLGVQGTAVNEYCPPLKKIIRKEKIKYYIVECFCLYTIFFITNLISHHSQLQTTKVIYYLIVFSQTVETLLVCLIFLTTQESSSLISSSVSFKVSLHFLSYYWADLSESFLDCFVAIKIQ